MTLGPFRFTVMAPGTQQITLPTPLTDPTLGLLTRMQEQRGERHTARRWASLTGQRLSVVEAHLSRLEATGRVQCSAQLWEAV